MYIDIYIEREGEREGERDMHIHAQEAWVGSAGHDTGECSPCVWFHKEWGCRSGAACQFCHLCEKSAFRKWKCQQAAKARLETQQQQLTPPTPQQQEQQQQQLTPPRSPPTPQQQQQQQQHKAKTCSNSNSSRSPLPAHMISEVRRSLTRSL